VKSIAKQNLCLFTLSPTIDVFPHEHAIFPQIYTNYHVFKTKKNHLFSSLYLLQIYKGNHDCIVSHPFDSTTKRYYPQWQSLLDIVSPHCFTNKFFSRFHNFTNDIMYLIRCSFVRIFNIIYCIHFGVWNSFASFNNGGFASIVFFCFIWLNCNLIFLFLHTLGHNAIHVNFCSTSILGQ